MNERQFFFALAGAVMGLTAGLALEFGFLLVWQGIVGGHWYPRGLGWITIPALTTIAGWAAGARLSAIGVRKTVGKLATNVLSSIESRTSDTFSGMDFLKDRVRSLGVDASGIPDEVWREIVHHQSAIAKGVPGAKSQRDALVRGLASEAYAVKLLFDENEGAVPNFTFARSVFEKHGY